MTGVDWLLVWQQQSWQICRSEGTEAEWRTITTGGEEPADAARTIADGLRELGYSGEPVVLGLPSHKCLVAQFETQRKSRDYTGLVFALENRLPISAEEIVADFVHSKESSSTLGLAVELSAIEPILRELEEQDVAVVALCPTACLALQNVLKDLPSAERQLCLWQYDDWVDFFVLQHGRLSDWFFVPATKEDVLRQLHWATSALTGLTEDTSSGSPDSTAEGYQIAAFALDETLLSHLAEQPIMHSAWDDLHIRAARQARHVARGRQTAWIDLRHHALAIPGTYGNLRGRSQALVAVALLFLLTLCFAVHWRGNQYWQLADTLQQTERQIYEQVFPGQKIPVGIRSRFESEHARLVALSEQTGEFPKLKSELETLLALLRGLPDDVPTSWDHIHLESPGRIELEGKITSQDDARAIAQALVEGGFELESPQTKQLPSQLLSLSIVGRRTDHVR